MTWRERLVAATEAVPEAEEHRNAVMREAREAGFSLREIGSAVGVQASTVMRWSGDTPRDVRRPDLDSPSRAQREPGA